MAYNNYYPGYNPFPYQQYQPPAQQPAQVQGPVQQIQNGGFVSVRNIEEAYNWPVAPGNSITFKDENAPYVYTKTKGFSPLEQPTFEKYRLVKEEDKTQPAQNSQNVSNPAPDYTEQINMLWAEINALKWKIDGFMPAEEKPVKKAAVKKEVVANAKNDE